VWPGSSSWAAGGRAALDPGQRHRALAAGRLAGLAGGEGLAEVWHSGGTSSPANLTAPRRRFLVTTGSTATRPYSRGNWVPLGRWTVPRPAVCLQQSEGPVPSGHCNPIPSARATASGGPVSVKHKGQHAYPMARVDSLVNPHGRSLRGRGSGSVHRVVARTPPLPGLASSRWPQVTARYSFRTSVPGRSRRPPDKTREEHHHRRGHREPPRRPSARPLAGLPKTYVRSDTRSCWRLRQRARPTLRRLIMHRYALKLVRRVASRLARAA